MQQRRAVWKGTDADLERLKDATAHNCACMTLDGVPDQTCSAHRMLSEQRILDGLDMVRHNRNRYRREEFTREPTDG